MESKMTFTAEITLGNDAMQTAEQLAQAIEYIANRIRAGYDAEPIRAIITGRVRDDNGNRVGDWKIR
jgi:hypothetical protein